MTGFTTGAYHRQIIGRERFDTGSDTIDAQVCCRRRRIDPVAEISLTQFRFHAIQRLCWIRAELEVGQSCISMWVNSASP